MTTSRSDLSDIRNGDWVDRRVPRSLRPYARLARLDRPIGVWLTLFPCWAALIQASHGLPNMATMVVFSLGALLMRSAGSTINDLADRNFDGHVERTRFRPLASRQLTVRAALAFLGVELALAALLLIFLTPLTRFVALGVLPLVILYPFCKRFTHWPQAVLGAAFNWGMLMAWSQVTGTVPAGAVVMWLGAVAWQVGYDTIYAYVDAGDDARLGLKSTAILFGRHGKGLIGLFYAMAIGGWSLGGSMVGMSPLYVFGLVFLSGQMALQVWRFDLARPYVNFRQFRASILTGAVLAATAFLGTFSL